MQHGTIATDLHKFCGGCKEIEPVASIKVLDDVGGYSITKITCKHYDKCKRIADGIKERLGYDTKTLETI